MSAAVEAVYIFDSQNDLLLSHTYRSRPPPAHQILSAYLSHVVPRPSILFLTQTTPPTILFCVLHSSLLFLSPATISSCSLSSPTLEFLRRLIEVLEDYLGAPLLASKITSNYDVIAQLLMEMCDGGNISNTESNSLRDIVEIPGWVEKLLSGVRLPSSQASQSNSSLSLRQPTLSNQAATPLLPWRRANVRHLSNELYVDILESLSITVAPSGRPLCAMANGLIAVTSKITGMPDLTLTLTAPGGQTGIERAMELPIFHPCVRLTRWRAKPGELSFIPPDGKFILASYEVDLLPEESHKIKNIRLPIPVMVDIQTSLGPTGAEFEVRLNLSPSASPGSSMSSAQASLSTRLDSKASSSSFVSGVSLSSAPTPSSQPLLEDLLVIIALPSTVSTTTDIRASRGEATFHAMNHQLEWRVPSSSTTMVSTAGVATLRCSLQGGESTDEDDESNNIGTSTERVSTDESKTDVYSYQVSKLSSPSSSLPTQHLGTRATSNSRAAVANDSRKASSQSKKHLMPTCVRVSFTLKNRLASGIKVESLALDTRRSRGVGEGVKLYKGVKYLTVCQDGSKGQGGWEIRC